MTITTDIPINQIRGLLCNAFEGGSNYWYQITGQWLADGLTMADFKKGGKLQDPNDYWHWAELIPTVPGCCLFIESDDYRAVALNHQGLMSGLEVMARDYPRHYANLLAEDDDAETGDVFLQCCLYGTVIYG